MFESLALPVRANACDRLAPRATAAATTAVAAAAGVNSTLCEDTNRKRRRLHKAHHLVMSIMLSSWGHHASAGSRPGSGGVGGSAGAGAGVGACGATVGPAGAASPYRTLCLLTAGLAFALGLVVGVMIPLYVLPRGAAAKTPAPAWRYLNASLLRQSARNLSAGAPAPAQPPAPPTPPHRNGSVGAPRPPVVADFPSVSFVAQAAAAAATPVLVLRHDPHASPVAAGRDAAAVAALDVESEGGVVRGGVYWGRRVEEALPAGFSDAEADTWRRFTRRTPVVKVEEGCGRMQNRLLTFEDGTRSCCRYRQNTDQIQGEVFSFYLGRLLGLRNLAPSALALVRPREPLWSRVRPQLSLAQWGEERAVVLTRFVPALEPAHIPSSLRTSARRLHPPDVGERPADELVELAQWSDLIVFDYLTANLDRVVNNLYNLQWNPAMMDAPAHNLAREPGSGLLVFFDNESGLLHGYRLLDKYEHYHGALLEALCVFRKSTADAVRRLHAAGDVGERLQRLFADADPELRDALPSLPDKSVKILNERLARVHERIGQCERQYRPVHTAVHGA